MCQIVQEREEKTPQRGQGEEVVVPGGADVGNAQELHAIVSHNGNRDHDRLSNLQTIDAGQDIDGIRAEDAEHRHEDIV